MLDSVRECWCFDDGNDGDRSSSVFFLTLKSKLFWCLQVKHFIFQPKNNHGESSGPLLSKRKVRENSSIRHSCCMLSF